MKRAILFLAGLGICFFAGSARGEEAAYVGVKKCKTCHIKVYQTWKQTKHAGAFDKLNEQEKQDPKCFECHTTNKDVSLPGVQCEACHGAGCTFSSATIMNKKKYEADPEGQRKLAIEAGLIIQPNEASCKKCHNERSPHYKPFDFKKRYEEIKHTNK
jgi:hypothetical protein